MAKAITVLLIIVGVIHLIPLSGVWGTDRLTALYGMPFRGPDLVILMRHRAVLFGLLGVFLICAAFRPSLQWAAVVAGVISVASFIVLAAMVGQHNEALRRVVLADWVALGCLVAAGLLLARRP